LLAGLALAAGLAAAPHLLTSRTSVTSDFVHFESAHVHPVCLTPTGDRLLVVNTPDNRLSVFDVSHGPPAFANRIAEIPVGLEPVSVAARSDSEAWVVNQLSDDVSIVNLNTLHVRATLRVGDEPADVVFAGSPARAYVSVSQYDEVLAIDPASLATVATIPINGRTPRALARTPGGSRVYAAVLDAGNRTSVLSQAEAGDSLPLPSPPMNPGLPAAPKVGLIIKQQPNGNWLDEAGKLWSSKARYSVFDTDIAEISTASNGVTRSFGDLNTVNLALAVSPADSTVALTGTEARNLTRFEPNLRGHLVDTRLALVAQAGTAALINLNPAIDYSVTPGPQAERDSAIGNPTGAAWSADGQRLYVTALADNRLVVLTAAGAVRGRAATVPGPTGVVVDDARQRLYVVGRFHNEVQTLSTLDFSQLGRTGIGFDPTPDAIVNGRKFFYGGFTSGHGDQACATCHVHGDFDNIAWDLGNPQGAMAPKPPGQIDPALQGFHPMKGPMTTQSLRGLPGTILLHWRGDRADLNAFNGAFVSLMGRAVQLPDSEMAAFNDFVLPLVYPPNPNQLLDRTVPSAPLGQPSAARGQTFFFNQQTDLILTCSGCHAAANFGPGTNGQVIDHNALQESQDIKVPQLRNLYKKTGFTDQPLVTNKRGFGFIHDGSMDNLFDFLHFSGFSFPNGDADRRDVEAFLLHFDTGMAPAVGYQITFDGTNSANPLSLARLDTLRGQAEAAPGNCDLVARGRVGGQPRGWAYQGGGMWKSDKGSEPLLATAQLIAMAGLGSELTLTGVPRGSGTRAGIDRDRDGFLDGDELDAHSDPGSPASTPANVGVTGAPDAAIGLRAVRPNPFRTTAEVELTLGSAGPVDVRIYDVLGREVRSLARGERFEAGPQRLHWDGRIGDGRPAGPGVYFVKVRLAGREWTRTVVRLR
jgi:YVTN family beta-propeller protein